MVFVQIIEIRTKNYDQLQALGDEFSPPPRASAPCDAPL
jgi:hypothetical protein